MIQSEQIRNQLPFVLSETNFHFLGRRLQGKVRDSYVRGERRLLIATDRLSCFDVVVTTIPFKGQVLNQLAADWFKRSSDIVENHVLDVPDENVMLVRQCEILPVEVVVRGYLAGSALRDYEAGRDVSGLRLPPGMGRYAELPEPIITPSTKAESGAHDLPISEREIIGRGLVTKAIWSEAREKALALFALGQRRAAEMGLILADTKYEFGLLDGRVVLADEIHTLDSSRYWVQSGCAARVAAGGEPEMLDKEPTRQWLLSQGYKGEGTIPEFSDEHRVKIAEHYISAYERILGKTFDGTVGSAEDRIARQLKALNF